jgi:hypothetical protein
LQPYFRFAETELLRLSGAFSVRTAGGPTAATIEESADNFSVVHVLIGEIFRFPFGISTSMSLIKKD